MPGKTRVSLEDSYVLSLVCVCCSLSLLILVTTFVVRKKDHELQECKERLEQSELHCTREMASLKIEDKKFDQLLAHNSELKTSCVSLREQLVRRTAQHQKAIDTLQGQVHDRDQTIATQLQTIKSLETEDRQALVAKCALLESEKAALAQQCKELQSEVTRLRDVDADNAKLRANIALLNEESTSLHRNIGLLREQKVANNAACEDKIANISRISEAYIQALTDESQAKCAILKEQAGLKTLAVEKEASAWKVKWVRAAKEVHDLSNMMGRIQPQQD